MRSFLFSLSIIFTAGSVHGETLVVRQEHPAASDQNPGTETKPLKTISAAAARVKAGDRVVIHRGDYRETVMITASGTEAKPIVFEAASGETPVIKGSDILSGWEREEGEVWKLKLPPLPPKGSDFRSAAFWNTNDVRQVFIRDGALTDAHALRRVTERAAMTAGSFFCDKGDERLFVWMPDSSSPVNQRLEISRRTIWLRIQGSHVIFRGLAMRHASTTAIANWPACSTDGERVSIEDCTISWGDFVGISLEGNNNGLRRSVVACHGASGMGGKGEGHTIIGCRFLFNNIARYQPDWHAGGVKLIPKFRHGLIKQNEFAHNLGQGLWLDGGCDGNVIDGNYAHDNEGVGIMVEISTGNLIMNNVATMNRNTLSGPFRDGDGVEHEFNFSENRIGISRVLNPYHAGDGRGIYISSAPETKVLHNTCYMNEGEGICVEGPPRSDGEKEVTTRDYVIMNNISVFNHGSQLTAPKNTPDKAGSRSDHNLLFALGAVLAKDGWKGEAAFTIDDWRRISAQDAHSLDADPRFLLAAMNDFRLLPGSRALSAGERVPEADHDFFGNKRSGAKVTLGAFEAATQDFPTPLQIR